MTATKSFVVLAVLIPAMAAAQAVAPPPQPLHLVGDHWTPYDPPSEFPEGSTVHTVVQGDTLWDLAASYLGDPYLWPQIWERNPYIKDSHWIYPGDPIVIDVAVQEPEVVEEPEEVVEFEDDWGEREIEAEDVPMGKPYPLGSSADVYCFVRLVEDASAFPFTVVSGEKSLSQKSFSEGDVIYLDGGAEEGVQAGDRFFILNKGRGLDHPVSGSGMGVLYHQIGQVKVLCAQQHTAIAEITYACDPIRAGNVLLPYTPTPVPLVMKPDPTSRCDEPNGKPTGYIVYNRDDVLDVGTDMLVLVDLGARDGLYPGQFATIYRDNPVAGMPRLVTGELGILTVNETYSTAKITNSWTPARAGDRIELK